jgi:hypothetical protein
MKKIHHLILALAFVWGTAGLILLSMNSKASDVGMTAEELDVPFMHICLAQATEMMVLFAELADEDEKAVVTFGNYMVEACKYMYLEGVSYSAYRQYILYRDKVDLPCMGS